MNQIYETDKTCYLFALTKDGKNFWKKINRPEKIVICLDQVKGIFQFILFTDEDLSEFYSENVLGFTFTLSNDPQQDPYGEITNLGYSSIKIHAFKGNFIDNQFNYITKLDWLDKAKDQKTALLRNNFGCRFPSDIMGPQLPLFDNKGQFLVYKLSFIDVRPEYLVIDKLSINDGTGVRTKIMHDMYNSANGSKVLETKYVIKEEIDKNIEELVK